MTQTEKYWKLRNAGLCVCCRKPVSGKSRCPDCMKDNSAASKKSQANRIEKLRAKIRELGGEP